MLVAGLAQLSMLVILLIVRPLAHRLHAHRLARLHHTAAAHPLPTQHGHLVVLKLVVLVDQFLQISLMAKKALKG